MFRQRTRTVLRYVRETGSTVLADGRGPVLAVVALGWLLVSGTRFVVPALLPRITTTFAVSNTAAGFAVTLIWLTYASLQFPAGLLTDRWGERTLLLLSIFVGAVSVLAFAVSPGFGVFLGACLLLGIAIGLFGLPRVTLLARVYPRNDGTALGLTFAAGNVGSVVLPFVDGRAVLSVLAVLLGLRAGVGPLNNAYLVAVLPDDVEGVSYGLLRTVYLGIGASGSVAVGAFADADLFDEAFLVLGGLTAVVFGLYVLLPSRPDT